jgi:hypothetical protein
MWFIPNLQMKMFVLFWMLHLFCQSCGLTTSLLCSDNSVNCICNLKLLKTLKIGSTIHGISVDELLKIVIHCNTLNNLDISNGIILDWQQFQKLIKSGTSIEFLNISGSEVSDYYLVCCILYLKKLKTLIVINCHVSLNGKTIEQNQIPGMNIYILPQF